MLPPRELGTWRRLRSEEERDEWLERACRRFFAAAPPWPGGTPPRGTSGRTFVIDGEHFDDFSGFLCAMGEAVNGPGGYFGSDYESFDDCMFGGFGLEGPCTIVWRRSARSRTRLDADMLARWCIAGTFEIDEDEHADELAEGRAWCSDTLAAARRGERTFFDELVAVIESVSHRHLSRPGWVITLRLE